MESLHELEIIVILLAVVLALTTLAHRILLPYPILLVIGGLILGVVPGMPRIQLNPDLVFLVVLPPILWGAAYFTSWRDFRQNLRPITWLAVGLVLVTTAMVAVLTHAVLPGISWAGAVVLGAIVSPPDAIAATAIARKLGIPRRLVTILEGESLVNDATALVLYRTAVGAAVSGSFILSDTLMQFVLAAVGGIAAGLVVGALTRWVLRFTRDSSSEIAMTLLASYVAWVIGEVLQVSAVLACVAGGLYLRRYFSEIVSPITRIQARAVWETVIFILNGIIFILIGLQVASLRDEILASGLSALLLKAALISVVVIGVRLIWVPLAAYLSCGLIPSIRAREAIPPSHVFLMAWTGMRGIVSLAAALALPHAVSSGASFPYRAEIIVITFVVILSTLVLQGLSLTPLIRMLKLEVDQTPAQEEALARQQTATAALNRLDDLAMADWTLPDHLDRLRIHYGHRVQRFVHPEKDDPDCSPQGAEAFRRLRQETLTAERVAAIELRNRGVISDEVLHRLEQELDVEAVRLGLGDIRSNEAVPSGGGIEISDGLSPKL
jgi:CPA1 family monovalent cation:H+ antiporter